MRFWKLLIGAFAVSFGKPKRLVASLRLNRWLNIAWLMAAWVLLQLVIGYLGGQIGLMLAEGVVAGPEDIDLCMILGARWPMFLGGITPYLDRVGASERVNGRKFLAAGGASEPAA